ncbi:TPA: pirin family protein [Candidatus Scatousia excrementigallinarum]|uniref:Pirin family protein n=1 Tax=Candidatus Scatousia excrementigallinarum TaxID=2840935 RepID=A0A9D1EYT6_9BACT|nr:pirin family protein [Candidatus Scatousia excrementigallinarum]
MIKIRKASERGTTKNDWLVSKHTFSFAGYYDPQNISFGPLRVINDDVIASSGGFDMHPHDNMEILTVVLSGELEHKDSMGNSTIIDKSQVQKMSAGTGIIHGEFNPSDKIPVHLLQIWIVPAIKNVKPYYEEKTFERETMLNKLCLLGSGNGEEGTFLIYQDVKIFESIIEKDKSVVYQPANLRKIWIHVATGAIKVNNTNLEAGDGMGIECEDDILNILGKANESRFLLFDMN